MPTPTHSQKFAAAARVFEKVHGQGLRSLTDEDISAMEAARELTLSYVSRIATGREGKLADVAREALGHSHLDKEYEEIERPLIDLCELALSMHLVTQQSEELTHPKIVDAQLVCAHLKIAVR